MQIANRLSPNASSKKEYMFIGSDYQLGTLRFVPQIQLGVMSIQRTNPSKSLGVFFDEWLSWAYHIEHSSLRSWLYGEGEGEMERARGRGGEWGEGD